MPIKRFRHFQVGENDYLFFDFPGSSLSHIGVNLSTYELEYDTKLEPCLCDCERSEAGSNPEICYPFCYEVQIKTRATNIVPRSSGLPRRAAHSSQ